MTVMIVVGGQWGDEGKGKIIDACTPHAQHIVRAQGGNNAGHTIIIDDEEYKLHLTPSGILHPHKHCYIGAGTVIDLQVLIDEWEILQARGIDLLGRMWISPEAHVIFPYHKVLDRLLEEHKGTQAVGTTGRGIGPCYADKVHRIGIRIGDLLDTNHFANLLKNALAIKNREFELIYHSGALNFDEIFQNTCRQIDIIAPYIKPIDTLLDHAIAKNENILLEGAQGTFLDVTSGTYPFVTSSNTTAGGICIGAEIGPTRIGHTLGVLKAYNTRVGNGPMPTEIKDDAACFLDHKKAREFGTTTGRKRRCGWFDAVLAKAAVRLNGLDSFALTKLDILDQLEEINICVAYEMKGAKIDSLPTIAEDWDKITPIYETLSGWKTSTTNVKSYDELPTQAKNYIQRIEELCGIPLSIASVGPARDQTLIIRHPLKQEPGSK